MFFSLRQTHFGFRCHTHCLFVSVYCRSLLLSNLSLSSISLRVMAVAEASFLLFLFLWSHFPRRINPSLVALRRPPISCANPVQSTVPIFLMPFPTSSFRPALCHPLSFFVPLFYIYMYMYLFTLCSPFCCEVWFEWGELRDVTDDR
jgi:hypothetical protein